MRHSSLQIVGLVVLLTWSGSALPAGETKTENACSSLPKLLLRPVDWLRVPVAQTKSADPISNLHLSFARRNEFQQFTLKWLSSLEQKFAQTLKSTEGLTSEDRALLEYEYATVLMQNRPTPDRLFQSRTLLQHALSEPLDPATREKAAEILTAVEEMLAEPPTTLPLRQINWAVFNRCPLVCKGCYNNFTEHVLPLAEAKAIAEKLRAAGAEELIISGGDPLTWPEIIPFIDHLHALGFKVAVDSVGYNMTPELAAQLKGKVTYVGIPLDGSSQEVVEHFRKGKSDLLEKSKRAIEILTTQGVPVKINTTVNSANVHDLPAIAAAIEAACGGKCWSWSMFQWWDLRAPQELKTEMAVPDALYQQKTAEVKALFPQLPAYAGAVNNRARSAFFVAANGEVYTFGKTNTTGTIILGDLKSEPVAQIINSPALRKDSPKFRNLLEIRRN